jgi:hypothetical protein
VKSADLVCRPPVASGIPEPRLFCPGGMGLSIENSINTGGGQPRSQGDVRPYRGERRDRWYAVRVSTAFTLLVSKRCSLRKTRKTRKGLVDETLVLNLRVVPKVDQQPEWLARRFEVVDHLGAMFVGKALNRFDLHDDPPGFHFRVFRVFRSSLLSPVHGRRGQPAECCWAGLASPASRISRPSRGAQSFGVYRQFNIPTLGTSIRRHASVVRHNGRLVFRNKPQM